MATRKKPLTPAELAEAEVKQLRHESAIPKMKVSEAIRDLTTYIEEHQNDDYLVRGFDGSPKKNPFRKKKVNACILF